MDTPSLHEEILCPSAPCRIGSSLIGIVNEIGKVSFLGKPFLITDDFVATANTGNLPESRFRFSAECAEAKCKQWSGKHCMVGSVLVDITSDAPTNIPDCGIRSQCRWFKQENVSACRSCSLVITQLA